MNSPVVIGRRSVGDGFPCFVTYEAGPTHTGLESAKALVDVAADAGADAVKFQIFDPDRLVADKKQLFAYQVLANRDTGALEDVEEPLYDILVRRCMPKDDWRALKAHADARGLAFFATASFAEDVALIAELGCDSIKIASADVDHLPFIRLAARTGLVIQLDTGNASLGEIETAVDAIVAEGNRRIIIHQCPSGYPARLPSIHLRMIPTLKHLFPFPVAYSDHTPGWEMDVAALALGANLVEKTITFDRTTRSVEHVFSLEPHEAASFVQILRDVETAMGEPRRPLPPEQLEKRKLVRRSAFLVADVPAGTVVAERHLDWRRPGTGIRPSEADRVLGATTVRDLPAGTMLAWSDLRT